MAHPRPFRIETPPLSAEDTAKKLGVSAAELRRVKRAVQEILKREHTGRAARQRPRKLAAGS
jgi:hypothetical protein